MLLWDGDFNSQDDWEGYSRNTLVLLPKLFTTENGKLARDVHACLGSATMTYLLVHLGLILGFSF